jgi:hypothetical protein
MRADHEGNPDDEAMRVRDNAVQMLYERMYPVRIGLVLVDREIVDSTVQSASPAPESQVHVNKTQASTASGNMYMKSVR